MANEFSAEVSEAVRQPYPQTVLDVLARMEEVQIALGGWDSTKPLAAFNFLYHCITSSVAHRLGDLDSPALKLINSGDRTQHPLFAYFERAVDEVARLRLRLGPVGLEDPHDATPRTRERDIHPRLAALPDRIEGGFANPRFMRTLDVNFAELYLRALRGWADGKPVPQAWEVLFSHWDDAGGEGPFSGAILGVNAHINHDLAIAVLRAHEAHSRQIDAASSLYSDYLLINDIFEVQTPLLHAHLIGQLDGFKFMVWNALGSAGLELVAQRILAATREWAWVEATNMAEGTTARPTGEPCFINPTTDRAVGAVAKQLLDLYM